MRKPCRRLHLEAEARENELRAVREENERLRCLLTAAWAIEQARRTQQRERRRG